MSAYPGHVLAPVMQLYILGDWVSWSESHIVCMHVWWMTAQEVIQDLLYLQVCRGHTVHMNQCWYTAPRRVAIFIGWDAFQIAVITILSMYILLCTVCTYVCTWNIQLTVILSVSTYVLYRVTSAIGLWQGVHMYPHTYMLGVTWWHCSTYDNVQEHLLTLKLTLHYYTVHYLMHRH